VHPLNKNTTQRSKTSMSNVYNDLSRNSPGVVPALSFKQDSDTSTSIIDSEIKKVYSQK
jgi:hypothetical protein